jgi:argininosuccinate synthase
MLLIAAHRELEKLVLTARQQRVKDQLATSYGDLVHEGQFLEPACRDIEALFASTQERVTGQVKAQLRPGSVFVEGVASPFSLKAASRAVYGEAAGEWTATDARGFSRMLALPGMLAARAGTGGAGTERAGTCGAGTEAGPYGAGGEKTVGAALRGGPNDASGGRQDGGTPR